MPNIGGDRSETVGYQGYNDREKALKMPTEEELNSMSLKELLKFRGEFEEKLDYMRKHNAADNKILLENEKYHRMIEKIIKEKIAAGDKEQE